jgi:hypothetical protein
MGSDNAGRSEEGVGSMKTKSTKTRFVSLEIRELTKEERKALDVVRDVLCGRILRDVIGKIPAFLCLDDKDHPLVLDKFIVDKIRRDHGNIVAENLVINVHDWDFGIKNMDKDPDKITLVKTIPSSQNYFIAGAKRDNGFFMVTHFEVITKFPRKLKHLLKRGDVLDHSGRTPSDSEIIGSLHVNSSKEERSSLERLFSGVETIDRSGVPSEAPKASPIKLEKVSSDNDTELLVLKDSKSKNKVNGKKVNKVKERLRSPSC